MGQRLRQDERPSRPPSSSPVRDPRAVGDDSVLKMLKRLRWYRHYFAARLRGGLRARLNRPRQSDELLFVVPSSAKGWILDGICKGLHRYYPAPSQVHYQEPGAPLPAASAYFLFGAAFVVPAWWTGALLLIMLVRTATDLTSIGIFLGESSHEQMLIQYAAAALTLGGLFVLIPYLGVTGLVLALLAGATLRLGLFYRYSQRRRWLPYPKLAMGSLMALYLAGSAWTASQPPGTSPVALIAATALVLGLMAAAAYLTGRDALVPRPAP